MGAGSVSRSYIKTVYVRDPSGEEDADVINITVIEVNNAPRFNDDDFFGAHTVYLQGSSSNFYEQDVCWRKPVAGWRLT